MGSFDDYVALMEDWSNPLLDSLLPSVMNDIESIFADQTDQNPANVELGGASNSNALAEPEGSNRGGLRESVAAKEKSGGASNSNALAEPEGSNRGGLRESIAAKEKLGGASNSSALAEPEGSNRGGLRESIAAKEKLGGASNSNALAEPEGSNRGGLRERIAAKENFNTLTLNTENLSKDPEEIQAPYLTIPPGLSPTSLLDSPVFLSNSQALTSPTTGKLPSAPNENDQNSAMLIDDTGKGKENTFQDANAPSFAYNPVAASSAYPYFHALNKVNPPSFAPQSCSSYDANISDNMLLHQIMEPYRQNNADLVHQKTFTNNADHLSTAQLYNMFGVQETPPLNAQEVVYGQHRGTEYLNVDGGPAEDGYNWKKYGQKPVRGSNFPRSYFKCTYLNCTAKKKVERSIEGYITEIVYKGGHNHPNPSIPRFPLSSQNPLGDTSAANTFDWSNMLQKLEENNSTMPDVSGFRYDSLNQYANLSNGEDDDVTHGSSSLGCDGEGEESESKRRKTEPYGSDVVEPRPREPRVVVQTTSEIDILDDGYRWRKYGQKVVKGNPNPRSYYKCTTPSCNVRKHVERASHDLRSVLTTYEGRHTHAAPDAGNNDQQVSSNYMGQVGGNQPRRPYNRQRRWRHGSGPPAYVYEQPGQGMAGLGHQYTGQQTYMAPPVPDSSLGASDAFEAYNQFMNQMSPPGPLI